jgi:hypothetical protein
MEINGNQWKSMEIIEITEITEIKKSVCSPLENIYHGNSLYFIHYKYIYIYINALKSTVVCIYL